MEETRKDEQNQSLKNSKSDSSHSKYFPFQKGTLKQPIIGKNNMYQQRNQSSLYVLGVNMSLQFCCHFHVQHLYALS
jgi:hypothetical protein